MDSIKNFFSTIWKAWKAFGQLIGDFVGRIFLMIFYLTITLPFGIGVRLFGDPLDIKDRGKSPAWLERKTPEATIEVAHQQF
jgi:hypothetical protein